MSVYADAGEFGTCTHPKKQQTCSMFPYDLLVLLIRHQYAHPSPKKRQQGVESALSDCQRLLKTIRERGFSSKNARTVD